MAEDPMMAEQVDLTMMTLKAPIIERILGGELSHLLVYPPGAGKPAEVANQRRPRPCRPRTARCASRCRATATAASSRC